MIKPHLEYQLNKVLQTEKLKDFGFEKQGDVFVKKENLIDDFVIYLQVDAQGRLFTLVYDTTIDEEYTLHLNSKSSGKFVGKIKLAFNNVIENLIKTCTTNEIFQTKQSKLVEQYCKDKYQGSLEFLWEKFPNNAVIRRNDNKKWYLALLTCKRSVLDKSDSQNIVEIIDLRMKTDEIESKVDNNTIYQGYHMNKKHWISIILDESISDSDLLKLIDDSFNLAKK